ncbi:MAG: hypothetical protein OEN23_19960 [Paracoccaceae bacterium]|nr:hypothetical protein [Paracoccaceae bacterium]
MAGRKGSDSTESKSTSGGPEETVAETATEPAGAAPAGQEPAAAVSTDAEISADGPSSADRDGPSEPYDPYSGDDNSDDTDMRNDAEAILDDHPHEDEHHRSFAATTLAILVGVLVVAGLTLWAAPKLAPHMPAGIAQYLAPGQGANEERLAALEQSLSGEREQAAAKVSALEAELAALSKRVDEGTGSDLAAAAKEAADGAAADTAALAAHLATVDESLVGLREELAAMSTALSDAADGAEATTPEIAAKLAAMASRLDSLSEAVEGGAANKGLEAQLAALGERLDAVESTAAVVRDVQSAALSEVNTAIEAARLQAALDLLSSRLTGGLPYGPKLNEIAGMTGKAPPEALSAGAELGVATTTDLKASYGRHAHAAVAADVEAQAAGAAGAFGWLRSQLAGRPIDEQEGDGVGAVTSRIGARIDDGDLTAALAEAEALPDHAKDGLGRWLTRLRTRVGAEAALNTWRDELGAGG